MISNRLMAATQLLTATHSYSQLLTATHSYICMHTATSYGYRPWLPKVLTNLGNKLQLQHASNSLRRSAVVWEHECVASSTELVTAYV